MPDLDLDRLERLARAQLGLEISTGVTLLPGELFELVQRARRAPVTTRPACSKEGCDLGGAFACADPDCPQSAAPAQETTHG